MEIGVEPLSLPLSPSLLRPAGTVVGFGGEKGDGNAEGEEAYMVGRAASQLTHWQLLDKGRIKLKKEAATLVHFSSSFSTFLGS